MSHASQLPRGFERVRGKVGLRTLAFYALPLIVLITSISALSGWYFGIARLLDIWPGFSLMSFNTALSFVFASLMVFALNAENEKFSFGFGVLTGVLPTLSLLKYAGLLTLPVDDLLFDTTSSGGFMAANTAVGLFVAAVTGVLRSLMGDKPWVSATIAALGLAILGLGLTGLATYGVNIMASYMWVALTGMALHTAMNFVVLGLAIGLASRGLQTTVPNQRKEIFVTSAVVLVAVFITCGIWRHLLESDRQNTVDGVHHELSFIQELISVEFENLQEALERMADRQAARDVITAEGWQADAEKYAADFQQIPGIGLVDTDYKIIGVAPFKELQPAMGVGPNFNPDRTEAMYEAVLRGSSVLTKPFVLSTGRQSIVLFSPIIRDTEFRGLIAASIELKPMITAWLREDFVNFSVEIWDEDATILSIPSQFETAPSFADQREISVLNRTWSLRMVPDKGFVRAEVQTLSQAVLPMGMIVTLLLAIAINRSMAVSHQNDLLKITTHDLQNREARLEYMAQERELVISNTSEALIYLDRHKNVRLANDAAARLLKTERCLLVGRHFSALPFFYAQSKSKPTIDQLIEFGRIEDIELHPANYGDHPLSLSLSATPIASDSGREEGYVIVFYDITDRRHLEQSQIALLESLERSNEELTQFAHICSHDLQEPFRMIGAFSELLETHLNSQGQDDEQTTLYLKFLTDASDRGMCLIRDILDYSRVEHGSDQLTLVDSRVVVHEIFANFRGTSERKLELTQEDLPSVPFSRVQLMQLFQNLIGNAIKYAKAEGPIRVHVRCRDQGDVWRFEVQDNGIGIAEKNLSKIFEIFKRLHRRDQIPGTGIGLAICRKIVERHGGTISVESTFGEGSTFYFTLPKQGEHTA
jgi:signal transduction histidine kinase/sensor domain CHASE-containing protein